MDIIGIDNSVVDHIVSIDRLPKTDEEISMMEQSWQGGGKIATALVAAARLGARTGLLGVAGDDPFGDFIVQDLINNGVDTSQFIQEKGKDSNYCISLAERETKGRSFIGKWGSHRDYRPSDIQETYVKEAKCVHMFQFLKADIRLAEMAKKYGELVGFDADEFSEETQKHIELIDIFIGSEFFYQGMFHGAGTKEENCRMLQKRGPEVVIFTFGSRGCAGIGREGYFELPSFQVEAVDTTGAGDVFHGAFLYAYVCERMKAQDAARFASAVSAIKCTHLGGRAGIPTRKMVSDFLETGRYDDEELKLREAAYGSFQGVLRERYEHR